MIERSTDSSIGNLTSVHLKLMDFILEMQEWLIVRKSFTIIYQIIISKGKVM